jgi:hypothetical protein
MIYSSFADILFLFFIKLIKHQVGFCVEKVLSRDEVLPNKEELDDCSLLDED